MNLISNDVLMHVIMPNLDERTKKSIRIAMNHEKRMERIDLLISVEFMKQKIEIEKTIDKLYSKCRTLENKIKLFNKKHKTHNSITRMSDVLTYTREDIKIMQKLRSEFRKQNIYLTLQNPN